MKKLLLIPIILLVILSCSKSDNNGVLDYTNNNPNLIGKWQYKEFLGVNIGCVGCGPYLITNGYTINFNNNGTFTSTELTDYPSGTFIVAASNQVTLTYISATLPTIVKVKEILKLSTDEVVLNPIPTCFEGCAERYEKTP